MSHVTTRFDARKQLAKVTGQECFRYALGNVFVSPSDTDGTVWQFATDGRKLAIVEADGSADRPVLCPVDIWPRKNGTAWVELNGHWRNSEQRWSDEKPDGSFTECNKVVNPVNVGNSIELTLNPQFLADLAAAIDDNASDGVTLIIELPEKGRHVDSAVRVHGQIDGRSQFGLVMPLCAEERDNIKDWKTEAYNRLCDRLESVQQWRVDAALDAPEPTKPPQTEEKPEAPTPEATPEETPVDPPSQPNPVPTPKPTIEF